MSQALLVMARLCLAGWCGGAILFVLVTVTEIRSGVLPSMLLDQMVLLRFPVYYGFSFPLLSIAAAALGLVWLRQELSRSGRWALLGAGAALAMLLIDYFSFYLVLREMLLPIGSPRPASFHWYHRATEWANAAALVTGLLAAVLANAAATKPNVTS